LNQHKPKGFWNFDRCLEAAKQYKSRVEFNKGSSSAYRAALKNSWLDKICAHMGTKFKRNYWTKEQCQSEAMKYQSRNSFRLGSISAYSKASKQGWIEEICSHMSEGRKPNGYWTIERCKPEALKFTSRREFEDNSPAYQAALKQGWINTVCKHMVKPDHGYLHCVYCISNIDLKQAYIGVTRNKFTNRMAEHLRDNNRTRSKTIAQLHNTKFEQLTEYKYRTNQIKDVEAFWVNNFLENGWEILNETSAIGSIGKSRIFWTKERCLKEANKYKTKQEFRKFSKYAYNAASRKGWLDEISVNLTSKFNPNGYWTKERVAKAARKYLSRKEFRQKDPKAFAAASNNGWIPEVCEHIPQQKKPKNYWTKEKCHSEALKFTTIKEFKASAGSAYTTALAKGWKDEICSHMRPASRGRKMLL